VASQEELIHMELVSITKMIRRAYCYRTSSSSFVLWPGPVEVSSFVL
jgi:hypothetical protein